MRADVRALCYVALCALAFGAVYAAGGGPAIIGTMLAMMAWDRAMEALAEDCIERGEIDEEDFR